MEALDPIERKCGYVYKCGQIHANSDAIETVSERAKATTDAMEARLAALEESTAQRLDALKESTTQRIEALERFRGFRIVPPDQTAVCYGSVCFENAAAAAAYVSQVPCFDDAARCFPDAPDPVPMNEARVCVALPGSLPGEGIVRACGATPEGMLQGLVTVVGHRIARAEDVDTDSAARIMGKVNDLRVAMDYFSAPT